MPRVPEYQPDVGLPDVSPRARFDAPSFKGGIGAAVSQGLQQLGQQGAKFADQLQETREHEEAATAGLKLQEILAEVDEYGRGWERGDGEDVSESGDGMTTAVLGRLNSRAAEVGGQIASPQLRRRFETQVAEHARRYSDRYAGIEDKRLGEYFSEQNQQTNKISANRMRSSDDPSDVAATLADNSEIVAGYKLPDRDKAALNRYNATTVKSAFLDGQVERNPANAVKLLDEGFANDLEPRLIDQYRDEANAALRAQAAQARAEAAQAVAVEKDSLGAVEQTLNAGGGTPKDMLTVADRYDALGDKSKGAYWRVKAAERQAVQGSKDWNLPQIDARVAALAAKQGTEAGLTGVEAAELNGLKDQRTQTAARLSQPGGALLQTEYATGKPLPPVDLRNPASLRARAQAAEAAASIYGRYAVEPFLPNEVPAIKDLVQSGDPAQQSRALNIIAQLGSPRAIMGAAQQVSGDGAGAFRIAATRVTGPAGREVAAHILGGKAALASNPQLWQKPNPDTGKLSSAEQDANAIFAEYVPALVGLGPSAANDTFEAAKAYYASKMSLAGQTQFNHDSFKQAVETVIGRHRQGGTPYGGTSYHQGQRVVIPQGWTGEGVFKRIARATPKEWFAAGGGREPVWPDGSRVYSGQLRDLVPVWLGGTMYGFRSPRTNNFLPAKDGQPYAIDVAKVPWK